MRIDIKIQGVEVSITGAEAAPDSGTVSAVSSEQAALGPTLTAVGAINAGPAPVAPPSELSAPNVDAPPTEPVTTTELAAGGLAVGGAVSAGPAPTMLTGDLQEEGIE